MNIACEIKKILVLRNDHMGDLLLSLPAISAIKQHYPKAHLGILIQDCNRDILWNNPDIDEIIIDKKQNVFELAHKIKEKDFDMAVILYPCWRNGWLCTLSRIPCRIGTGYKPVGILFNKRVYIHRTKIACHEIDYCLRLADEAGVQSTNKDAALKRDITLWIKDDDKLYAQALLNKHNLLSTSPAGDAISLIGIHPGSGGSALNWSKESYAKLIDGLSERYKAKVVLSGSTQEHDLIEQIISKTHTKPINLAGQTNLGQLMALFSFYSLFIGPSTGPMHLADGLGISVIALFPPLPSQSPAKWGPSCKKHMILMPEGITCNLRKCKKEGCSEYNCMDKITTEQVLDLAAQASSLYTSWKPVLLSAMLTP
ncbi:glycosyltransferase family 9 protein [bacterium]|nr:glycosyltransferase family 9 protein [bacterium]MBU1752801.1 glycosyltransferase family 9 protein [bacterium]